ncbi:DMT family transporter [Streptomyces sp. NPDC052040]|uniref:DMT family transporter n=1 Tax=Streptomyces sp. NPDC052040 TaxID=3365682 RepID=UPI0037D7A145
MTAPLLAVALSLFSAVAYAAAAVAQERLAARSAGTGVLGLFANGAWWWSVALNACAALLHVAALKFGPLTLVQPLGALTLVAAVPLGARAAGRRVGALEWRGTALTLAGLAALLVTASGPEPDTVLSLPEALAVAGATAALIGTLALPHSRLRPGRTGLRHATASGFASGVASALTQTVTVAATDRSQPVLSVPVVTVALLVTAFATGGLLLSQTAYRDGLGAPLAVVTLANPVAAGVIGLSFLGEHLQGGTAGLLLTAAGAALASWGVVTLSRPVPAADGGPSLPGGGGCRAEAVADPDHPVAAVLALESGAAAGRAPLVPPQPAPPSQEHLTAL